MRKYLGLLLLAATVVGPTAACAARLYDQPRQDYHHWNSREERAYRAYLAERHREYRDFRRLDRREQDEYWEWRHSHSDRDVRDRRR
jgi:hypothetical protein